MVDRTAEQKTAVLDLFVARVRELLDCRLVTTGGLDASFQIRYSDGASSFQQTEIDEEYLRSFLLTFRKFVSNDEAIFVRKVANLLFQEMPGDHERELLKSARDRYTNAMEHGTVRFELNGTYFTPEQSLSHWINGRYFHDDPVKAERLIEQTANPIAEKMTKRSFMEVLVEVTVYVKYLRELVIYWRSAGTLMV
jgi:hypothetical protein